MKISKRLLTIAEMVDENDKVIDIGCDHALLDIYLKNHGIKCTASDINENALNIAKQNIEKHNLKDKIETVLSDGLEKIDVKNNHILIISGMGANTIDHILSNNKVDLINKIIIQSNNDLYYLRKMMIKKGFYLFDEKVIYEKNKYYVIIYFKRGYYKYSDIELYLGPFVILKRQKIDINYLKYIYEKENFKYKKIPLKQLKNKIKQYRFVKKIKGYI